MVMCCRVTLTERGRHNLCLMLSIANWIAMAGSFVVIGYGSYLKLRIQKYTTLVANYNSEILPDAVLGMGVIAVMIQIYNGLLYFKATNPRNRRRKLMMQYVVSISISTILVVVLVAGSMMCFIHIETISDAFEGGLTPAMQKYRDHAKTKEQFDRMQMQFDCCGSDEYTDWFHVAWINEEYLNVQSLNVKSKMGNGAYMNDDVPFSCCDPKSPRPCINHHVHDNSKHYNYDYNVKTTLHTKGCKEALVDFFTKKTLFIMGGVMLALIAVQIFLILASRFLHATMCMCLEMGDPTCKSYGYLCRCGESARMAPDDEGEYSQLMETYDGPEYDDTAQNAVTYGSDLIDDSISLQQTPGVESNYPARA